MLGKKGSGGKGKAGRVHIQEGIINDPTGARVGDRVGLGAKEMSVKGFTGDEVVSEGTCLEGGRESIRIETCIGGGPHLRVQEEGFERHVVADEANDDGVPYNGGGARKGFEEMASQVRLPLLA